MAKKEDTKIITPSEQERVRLLSRTPGVEPTVDMTTEISGVKYREIGPGVELELRGRPHFIYSGTFFIDPKVAREFTTGKVFGSKEELKRHLDSLFAVHKGLKAYEIVDRVGEAGVRSYIASETIESQRILAIPPSSTSSRYITDAIFQLFNGQTVTGSYDTEGFDNTEGVKYVEFTTGPIFASGDVLADFVEETFKDRIKDGWQGLSRRRTPYTWNENDPELRKRAGPLPAGSYVRPEVANLERVIFYER